jgi:hypothetical protein
MAQKAQAVRIFELINRGRIHSELFVEQLNPALILGAPVDQHLFFLALGFKRVDGHFAVQHDGHECS